MREITRIAVLDSQLPAALDHNHAAFVHAFILQHMAVQVKGDGAVDGQGVADVNVLHQLNSFSFPHQSVGHFLCRFDLCRRAPQRQLEGRFLLDVIVRQRVAILQLLASKNEPLLVGRDAFLVLNFLLHIINAVGGFHLQRDGLAGQRLDKELHGACAHA